MKRPIRHFSPSMTVACIALFVALGGTGYAASQGPGGHPAKIAKSLRGPRGHTGPRGATGPPGPAGPAGATGATGLANVHPATASFTAAANSQTSGDVSCPAGQKALGGGSDVGTSNTGVSLNSSFPEPSTTGGPIDSWGVDVNNTTTTAVPFTVYAICATTN